MKKYILTVLCTICFIASSQAQNKKPIQNNTVAYYTDHYMFDEAEKLIKQNINTLKRKRMPTAIEESRLKQINKMRSMIKATEEVTFIDSLVVDKNQFLNYIKLSPESGTLSTYTQFFNKPDSNGCTVYLSELGNSICYAAPDQKGYLSLYTSNLLGNGWSQPKKLDELEGDEAQNYPFMLSDGITLYYAAQGPESIGGYDIFVTRYDMDEKKFLYPENMGMPFNSPANDYMMAIDEINQIGWFATDRNQPENKVCLYMFIPNDVRKIYNAESIDDQTLKDRALITSIAATWKDQQTVKSAKNRLQAVINAVDKKKIKKDFEFVINDQLTYYFAKDFKSEVAKQSIEKWQKNKLTLQKNKEQLNKWRDKYATGNASQKQELTSKILMLEQQCEQDEIMLKEEEIRIRNAEIRSLSSR